MEDEGGGRKKFLGLIGCVGRLYNNKLYQLGILIRVYDKGV